MTKEEAAHLASILLAASEGKEIQKQQIDGRWDSVNLHYAIAFYSTYNYRIKPQELTEVWLVYIESKDGSPPSPIYVTTTREFAESYYLSNNGRQNHYCIVKFTKAKEN